MTSDLDANTGLPAVPEGYYWNLWEYRSRYGYGDVFYVDLRERREPTSWERLKLRHPKTLGAFFGEAEPSSSISRHEIDLSQVADAAELRASIRGEAIKIYDEFEVKLRTRELFTYAKSLRGEYPPKKLDA